MPRALYPLAKHLQIVLAVTCGFAFASQLETPAHDFTPQEVLAYASNDEAMKKTTFIVIRSDTSDWMTALRLLLNRNPWEERLERGAKAITFKEPLLVRPPVQLDEAARAQVIPIVEANSRVQTEQTLRAFEYELERLEKERDTLSAEEYRAREQNIRDRYRDGSAEALFEMWVKTLMLSVNFEKDYGDYYLLPTFYENEFVGYFRVETAKRRDAEREELARRFFKRPLNYPLTVSAAEARAIAGADVTPVLTDLAHVPNKGTEEDFFWLLGERAVGVTTGALYRVVNAQGEAVNPFDVNAEIRQTVVGGGAPWFEIVVPIMLEPLKAARYTSDVPPTPMNSLKPAAPVSLPAWLAWGPDWLWPLLSISISLAPIVWSFWSAHKKQAANKED